MKVNHNKKSYWSDHPFVGVILIFISIFIMALILYAFPNPFAKNNIDLFIEDVSESRPFYDDTNIPYLLDVPYPQAREMLTEAGWYPERFPVGVLNHMGNFNGNALDLWKAGYIENFHCYPTGQAACYFQFKRPSGETLVVKTKGISIDGDFSRVVVYDVVKNIRAGIDTSRGLEEILNQYYTDSHQNPTD